MPIYEYDCRDCGAGFEELVLSSGEAATCPACDGKKVERRLSVFTSPSDRAAKGTGGGCGCTPKTCGCH